MFSGRQKDVGSHVGVERAWLASTIKMAGNQDSDFCISADAFRSKRSNERIVPNDVHLLSLPICPLLRQHLSGYF